MFPEPESLAIRDRQSTDLTAEEHVADKHGAPAQDAAIGELQAKNVQSGLRIRAALRVAHLDSIEPTSPEGRPHEWTWMVKQLPRPPLVVAQMDGLNREELLANDSLGG